MPWGASRGCLRPRSDSLSRPSPAPTRSGRAFVRAHVAPSLHVDAGNASTLFNLFLNNQTNGSGIEAHFFVKKTGEIEQYRDTGWQADANLDANNFAVSIETQGLGAGEWNDAQLASIKR